MHQHDVGRADDACDRRDVANEIEIELVVDRRVDRVRWSDQEERIAIRSSGTVFKVTPSGTTVLHSFGGNDGANPVAGLIADASGNLYGTTEFGGASGN